MLVVYRSEGSASLRRVPLWLMGSNGTAPATGESGGQPQVNWLARGTATANTAATLSLVSANAGEYYVELAASEVSALGIAAIHYRSANAIPNSTYFQIVNFDSGDSMRLGQFALPTAVPTAAGGLPTFGTGAGQLNLSGGSVGIVPATLSGVTIDGVNRVNSSVTIANATYSAVTVRVDPTQTFSGVTVGVSNIQAGTYSGVTVGVNNVTAGVGSSIADRTLARSLAGNADGGRTVQDAFRVLRNRTQIDGSTITVYQEDDTTSAWTGSVTTAANSISQVNPAGGTA